MTRKTIIEYYDYTLRFYHWFYYKNSNSYALHYGFWFSETKNFDEALQNTNKFLAEKAEIKSGQKVLDAGCGVGGSVIWLAKNIDADITGITISEPQLEKAKQLAIKNGVQGKTHFLLRDYLKTGFPNNSFDVVWGIESICHADNKEDFLREAYRILKPGGKIVVCDGFRGKDPKNADERQIYEDFCVGLALPGLDTPKQFETEMKNVGFKKTKFYDMAKEIMPSSKRIYNMSRYGYIISLVLEKLHIVPHLMTANCKAGLVQYEAMKLEIGAYGVFYGEK